MPEEVDEFGIPIKKQSTDTNVDEFGIPLKKKEPSIVSPSLSNSTDGELASSSEPNRFNFLTGQNDIPSEPVKAPLEIPIPQDNTLRAATTPLETTAKDINTFDPNIAQKQEELNPKKEALARGVAKMGSLLLQSPTFAYDAAVSTTNYLLNKPLGLPDAPTWKQLSDTDESLYKTAISDLEGAVNRSSQEQAKRYDKEINQYLFGEKKDLSKGFDLLSESIIESIPSSIGLAFAASQNPTAAAALGTAAFGADNKRQLDEAVPDMPEDQKVMWSSLMGGTEMAMESLGLTKLGPMFKDVLKKSGKEAVDVASKELFDKSVGKILKQYLGVQAEEVSSEMANTFLQNIYAKASGLDENRKPMDGVWDSGLTALGQGAGMTTPTAALDIAITKASRKKAMDIQEQRTTLQQDLQSPDVSNEAKQAISAKLRNVNEQEADLVAEEKNKLEALSPDQKTEVDNLQQQANKIATAATDENISEQTKEILKQDLDEVDKKVEKIFSEPKGAEVAAQAQDIADEIDYLNEVKANYGKLSPEEQARMDELNPPEKVAEQPTEPATETGLVEGEQKAEPIELNPNIETTVKQEDGAGSVGVGGDMKPTPQKVKVLGKDVNMYNDYIPSKVEDIEPNAMYSFNANSKDGIPSLLHDISYANKREVNGVKSENWHASISGEELLKLYPKEHSLKETTKAETPIEEKPKPKVEKPADTTSLKEEDDLLETEKADDTETVKKLNDDISLMKTFSENEKVEKKFMGMIERAYKAKVEGKISRKTYTSFKNKAKDIIEAKYQISGKKVDYIEAQAKSNELFNKVKEKLIGQDYKKITLSSIVPITPKNVSDLIDLTNHLVNRGIQVYGAIDIALEKALATIKKNPTYKKLIASGELKEEDFDKAIKEANAEIKESEKEEEKPKVKPEQTESITGETRKRKTVSRMEAEESYKDILSKMPETEKFYESVSVKKAKAYINTALDEFEANEQLESLAKDMINGKNPFPEKVKNWAAALTVDRLRNISEKQGDEFQKNIYDQLAADLSAVRNKDVTVAATQTGLEAEASKILPSSKQGLVDFAEKAYSESYDSRLSKEQQADIKSFAEQITELLKTDEAQKAIAEAVESEIEKIAAETEGADWLEDMKSIRDSLKIDLSEC